MTIEQILLIIVVLFSIIVCLSILYFKNIPLPKIKQVIDISGRRQPDYDECIDEWIIENQYLDFQSIYDETKAAWVDKNEKFIKESLLFKRHRQKLYETRLEEFTDKYLLWVFEFSRNQTRYRQQNYQKTAYTVKNSEEVLERSLQAMLHAYQELEGIGFQTTRKKYFSKNQRKLMTPELRQRIKERDNYTCQICGKYMPDEVGLHIDHIISIKQGGKTVEDNLQVLCDKCNLKKGSRR